jgi:hypothetical protein
MVMWSLLASIKSWDEPFFNYTRQDDIFQTKSAIAELRIKEGEQKALRKAQCFLLSFFLLDFARLLKGAELRWHFDYSTV